MALSEEGGVGVSVVEAFLDAIAEDADGGVAVESGDFLTEATIDGTVFGDDDDLVVGEEAREKRFVEGGEECLGDDGGLDSFFTNYFCGTLDPSDRSTRADEGDTRATGDEACRGGGGVVGGEGIGRVDNGTARDTDCYGAVGLSDGPTLHGDELLPRGGGEVGEVGDVGEHRDVVEADVRYIVHPQDATHDYINYGGLIVDAEVLGYLVVGAL